MAALGAAVALLPLSMAILTAVLIQSGLGVRRRRTRLGNRLCHQSRRHAHGRRGHAAIRGEQGQGELIDYPRSRVKGDFDAVRGG